MMISDKEMNRSDGSGGFLFGVTDPAGKVTFLSPPGKIEMLVVSHREFAPATGSPGRDNRGGMGGEPARRRHPRRSSPTSPRR
jgi:hypothetical protein